MRKRFKSRGLTLKVLSELVECFSVHAPGCTEAHATGSMRVFPDSARAKVGKKTSAPRARAPVLRSQVERGEAPPLALIPDALRSSFCFCVWSPAQRHLRPCWAGPACREVSRRVDATRGRPEGQDGVCCWCGRLDRVTECLPARPWFATFHS